MEDAHTAELQLDEDNRTRNAFFAVYDGHGGMSFPVITCSVHHLKPSILRFFERKQERALPNMRELMSSSA